jgi:prepilin-type N-terminal cleavage/methylation domain-containing protein
MNLAPSSMRRGHLRGFTLIELLVVIAIIGILSAVVLASLNTARSKGNDAAAKSNLGTVLTQSAIYYDTNSGYSTAAATGVTTVASGNSACALAGTIETDPNVSAAIIAADKAEGGTGSPTSVVKCAIASGTQASPSATITVAAPATQWVIYEPLQNNATGMAGWCIDSTGKSEAAAAAPASGIVNCP